MTSRLYYADPIKALYMMREFGVTILDSDLGRLKPLYVAKESESIFEPKERDISDGACFYFKARPHENHMTGKIDWYEKPGWISTCGEPDMCEWYEFESQIIIMRDNKHFFMPNKESE